MSRRHRSQHVVVVCVRVLRRPYRYATHVLKDQRVYGHLGCNWRWRCSSAVDKMSWFGLAPQPFSMSVPVMLSSDTTLLLHLCQPAGRMTKQP